MSALLTSGLQSFADRLKNDERSAQMFEADHDLIIQAIGEIKRFYDYKEIILTNKLDKLIEEDGRVNECSVCGQPCGWGERHRKCGEAIMAAEKKHAIPEGYALVPIEPTRAMSLAGKHAVQDAHDMRFERDQAIAIWSKMLEAAKEVQS